MEGKGIIVRDKFAYAVKVASEACPGSRVILKNNKWIDSGITPEIVYVSDSSFDGYNFSDIDVFKKKINPHEDEVAKIYVLGDKDPKINFTVFHGSMDARGLLIWIKKIFKVLNNFEITDHKSEINDLEYLKKLDYKSFNRDMKYHHKLFPKLKVRNFKKLTTKRVSFNFNSKSLVINVAKIISEFIEQEKCKFIIPVDLRKHDENILTTSNMILPIYIDLDKHHSFKDIIERYKSDLKNNMELNINNADLGLIGKLPRFLLKIGILLTLYIPKFFSKYLFTGTISNLGRENMVDFSYEDFKAECFYLIPSQQPFAPINVAITQVNSRVELLITSYADLIPNDAMNELLSKIKTSLES